MTFYAYPKALREQLLWSPWFDVDITASAPASAAEEGCSPKEMDDTRIEPPADTSLLIERSRTRLSLRHAPVEPARETDDEDLATPHRTAADENRSSSRTNTLLSFKVACHLRDGVGIVVASTDPFRFWTAHVPLSALQASLSAAYPSVQLPDKDLLAAVERAMERSRMDRGEGGLTCAIRHNECASVPDVISWANTGRSDADSHCVPRATAREADDVQVSTCGGVWWLTVPCRLQVLRDYAVTMSMRIPCLALAGCDGCGTAVGPATIPSLSERFFQEMVYRPQQARLLVLADALMRVCQDTGHSVSAAVTSLRESYRALSAAHVARRAQAEASSHSGDSTKTLSETSRAALQAWELERAAMSAALGACFNGLALPAPVRAIDALADDLRRLHRGEASALVFTPRPAVTSAPFAVFHALDHVADAREASIPATDIHRNDGEQRTKRNRVVETSAETPHRELDGGTMVRSTPGSRTGPVPCAENTNEARKKKIRRLFS